MRKIKIGSKLGLLFWLLVLAFDVAFLIIYGRSHIDSDAASLFILSAVNRENPSLIASNFFYSTELVVFDIHHLYSIGLLFFPHNWVLARTLSMFIAFLLASVSSWAVMRECSLEKYAEWLAGFILCPISFWYQWQTIYAGEYIGIIIKSFVILLSILRICKSNSKKEKVIWWILLVFLSLMTGLEGIRQGMVFFAPLVIVAAIVYKRNENLFISTVISTTVYSVGALINHCLLDSYYSFLALEQQVWGGGTGSWITSFRWFLDCFGFCETEALGVNNNPQNVPLMSFTGISIGIGLFLGLIVLAAMIYDAFIFKKLSEYEKILLGLSYSMVLVICMVFTYLFAGSNYWQQTIPFGFVFIIIAINNFDKCDPKYRITLISGIAAMAVICSLGTCKQFVTKPTIFAEVGAEDAIDYLMENTDYTVGYAPFWLADKAEFMTNGEIEFYCSTNLPYETDVYRWLQRADRVDTAPTSHFFILMYDNYVIDGEDSIVTRPGVECIYDDGYYCIYAVD